MILVKDVHSREEDAPRLLVNTKGSCFLCLKESSSLSSGYYTCHPQTGQPLTFSPWTFLSYLEIWPSELEGLLQLPPEIDSFSVQICGDCGEVAERMGRLLAEIEEIQRKLSSCLVSFDAILEESEEDAQRKEEVRRRLEQDVDGGLNKEVVEILRKLTKDKCLTRLKKVKKGRIKDEILEESLLEATPEEPLLVQDLQTEWPNAEEAVPDVEQEISISLCEDSPASLLFSSVPDSSTILSIPPPPPAKSTSKSKPKKKTVRAPSSSSPEECSPPSSTSVQCPIDFYFHRKVDNRHACPFCSDTSPTLTNLRFHVIRAHPEQLFQRDPLSPEALFKSSVELMLFQVTKSAETGERNASGTKVIVKCQFCEDAKLYHDKRAFQCHLILNHYSNLTSALLRIQADPPQPAEPPCEKKRKLSPDRKKTIKKDEIPPGGGGGGGDASPKALFPCEHCGKVLSSSTSKWRHKTQYCEVLRSRGEIPLRVKSSQEKSPPAEAVEGHDSGFSGGDSEQCSPQTTVYLISPQGDILNDGGIQQELLQGEDLPVKEEDIQDLCDFNDFYDEDEVNNVLTMMISEGDPLHI